MTDADRPSTGEQDPPRRPKLRLVDARPVELEGQPLVALRDPLWPPDRVVLVSHAVAALASLFDGGRSVDELSDELARMLGGAVEEELVASIVAQLDEALLLDSPRYRADLRGRLARFRGLPRRPMTLAGECFSPTAEQAQKELDSFYLMEGGPGRIPARGEASSKQLRGVVAPHIDFQRGAPLYAQAYLKVAEGAADADLFVLLGTDHKGEVDAPFSLTELDYDTPFGSLPTDTDLVRALAGRLPGLVAGELAHAQEHSLELQAVMLRHCLAERAGFRVLPVLCGPLSDRQGELTPARREQVEAFIDELRALRRCRRVCFIAGADLAHLGPAFGTEPMGSDDHLRLERRDSKTLALLAAGDAEGFRADVEAGSNDRNICGTSAIYTLLRVLEPTAGTILGYRQCPVPGDDDGGSRVTVAAVSF